MDFKSELAYLRKRIERTDATIDTIFLMLVEILASQRQADRSAVFDEWMELRQSLLRDDSDDE